MDKEIILFAFPLSVLMEMDLANKMGIVQEVFKDIPEVQVLRVSGQTAKAIVDILERTN